MQYEKSNQLAVGHRVPGNKISLKRKSQTKKFGTARLRNNLPAAALNLSAVRTVDFRRFFFSSTPAKIKISLMVDGGIDKSLSNDYNQKRDVFQHFSPK